MSFYNIISIFASGYCFSVCLQALSEGRVSIGIILGIFAIWNLLGGIFIIKKRDEK